MVFRPAHLLGKYRDLMLAVTLFLILDMGVLAFNVVTSRQIEEDAARINTAGELRMLSQQLTKALLTLQQETRDELPTQTSLAQLSESREAFNTALAKLVAGQSAGEGSAASEGRELLDALEKTWRPIDREVAPVLGSLAPGMNDIAPAATMAVARNTRLMQQAADLTAYLEQTALTKAAQMRQIQIVAIGLAFLNFLFIVFKFLRRLNASDRQAEAARQETAEILQTVREGLFLLSRDGRVGSQRSASLPTLLGRPLDGDEDFAALLGQLVDAKHVEAARDFIDLLFNKKVKPSLVAQLNPLHEVEVRDLGGQRRGPRFLTFEFDQVRAGEHVGALLVTVFDVTQKVLLAQQLAGAEARAESEIGLLLQVLDQDPAQVADFLAVARERIDTINRELQGVRPTAPAYGQLAGQIARLVHTLKGEAGALGLATVERQAHAFEDVLADLRGRRDLAGDDLIPVAVAVGELLEQVTRVEAILARVRRFARPEASGTERTAAPVSLARLLQPIEGLALRIAEDLNRKVRLEVAAAPLPSIPTALRRLLAEVLPQLVRNAVVHGIEPEDERSQAGKAPHGTIRIEVAASAGGEGGAGDYTVTVRDDGRGLSPERLRRRLVETGLKTPQEAAAMRDDAVLAMIFQPGFSSLDAAHLHAGRGDGLAAVRDSLTALGGRLRISSRPNAFTEFTLLLKAPCPVN